MKSATVLASLAVVQGGNLNLKWSDCGDASTHGKVSGLAPTTVPLGSSTTVTGSGTVNEAVSAGNFEVDLKASIISKTFTGDICSQKALPLPLGTGTLTWEGLKCPVASGSVSIPVGIQLAASLPAALQSVGLTIKGTSSSGDKLLCMQINTAPAEEEVHPERAAQIKQIENTPGVAWKAGAHERFAKQAPGASKDLCGVKGDRKKTIDDAVARGEMERLLLDDNMDIPESFDSAENWPQCSKIINDIRDQSACGCCWAFAGAEAASDRMCIATNATIMLPLSAQDVCFNSNFDGCDGGQIDTPWSYIKSTGAVTGGQYKGSGPFGPGLCSDFSLPHCHHHGPQGKDPYPAEKTPGCPQASSPRGPTQCDSTAQAPHSDFASDKYSFQGSTITASGERGIQQAIMAGGPVETAFTVYSDFENYVSGVYHHVSGEMAGGHAVKFVGWGVDNGVKYWKVANSWNPYWGESGYFRIVRGTNEGGIEDGVVGSSPTAKWGKKSQNIVV